MHSREGTGSNVETSDIGTLSFIDFSGRRASADVEHVGPLAIPSGIPGSAIFPPSAEVQELVLPNSKEAGDDDDLEDDLGATLQQRRQSVFSQCRMGSIA